MGTTFHAPHFRWENRKPWPSDLADFHIGNMPFRWTHLILLAFLGVFSDRSRPAVGCGQRHSLCHLCQHGKLVGSSMGMGNGYTLFASRSCRDGIFSPWRRRVESISESRVRISRHLGHHVGYTPVAAIKGTSGPFEPYTRTTGGRTHTQFRQCESGPHATNSRSGPDSLSASRQRSSTDFGDRGNQRRDLGLGYQPKHSPF